MANSSRAWGSPTVPVAPLPVRFVILSTVVKLAFPPLYLSSLPKRAIGFAFPSGNEGKLLGLALLGVTTSIGLLLAKSIGPVGLLLMVWLTGGTGALMLYNSTQCRVAFLKEYCSSCRLRPIIEEHESMHLNGERSEDVLWRETMKKYTYEGLSLAGDPKICSFCPIAKKLRNA